MKKFIVLCLAALVLSLSLGLGVTASDAGAESKTADVTAAATAENPESVAATDAAAADPADFTDTKDSFQLTDILRVPISYIIKGAYFLIPNYAIALLLFAIAMKILLFPLSIKQQKNSVKQASLRPKEAAIRKRYAGRTDKVTQQKVQSEVMDLYQKEGFNPMGGCLPMLLQFPILLSLYNVIINPLKYLCGFSSARITAVLNKASALYATKQFTPTTADLSEAVIKRLETVTDFSQLHGIEQVNVVRYLNEQAPEAFGNLLNGVKMPDFSLFGFDLSQTPNFSNNLILLIIPVITFVIVFFSMKITKKLTYQPQQAAGDAGLSMKIMDWTMPLVSVYITFTVPAIVGLYWIYQNILNVVQQLILKLMYPIPTFTDEEMKRIEKEMNGKIKPDKKPNSAASRSSGSGKGSVRSLHHIDDDEYPDASNKKLANGNTPELTDSASASVPDRPPISPSIIAPAKMKGDGDRKKDEKAPSDDDQ